MPASQSTLSAAAAFTAAATSAGTAPTLRAFLADAVEQLSRLHGIDRATVTLVDDGRVTVGAAVGLPPLLLETLEGSELHPDLGTCGRAICTGLPDACADVVTDARYEHVREMFLREGIRAAWSVPLRLADGTILGSLAVYHDRVFTPTDEQTEMGQSFASVVALGLERMLSQSRLAASYEAVVVALSSALGARDEYTGEHSEATADLAVAVAERLGLGAPEARTVRQVAVLHDIGKLGVPVEILAKAGPLTPDEEAIMRQHPVIGERILAGVPSFRDVATAIRHEHERWDGHGYPDGLAGDAIPLASRIVFACDAWHAMTSDRPYRVSIGEQAALRELRAHAGTQFDPAVVAALLEALGEDPVLPEPAASPLELAVREHDDALSALVADAGADDLFVFGGIAPGVYSHLDGVGRGAGWAGNIEVAADDEPHVREALRRTGEPVLVAGEGSSRIVGPYHARSAVLVALDEDAIVVLGSATAALAGLAPESAVRLAEQARLLAADVSPAKRLADELEVLDAMRAITTIHREAIEDTLGAIADAAAVALSCEYAAVLTLDGEPALGSAVRGWQPASPELVRGALLEHWRRAESLPVVCQDAAARGAELPAGLRGEDGVASLQALPIGSPAIAMLLVVHADSGPRGFTTLCRRVAGAVSEAADVVIRRALAERRLEAENRRLHARLRVDALTGADSRAAWEEAIRSEELRHAASPRDLAVVVLDLDELKQVNDRAGHAAGDALLRDTARLLATTTGTGDVVARLGGDEFGVLLRDADGDGARAWCARLAQRLDCAGIAGSLGWAPVRRDDTIAAALALADRRMYAAKATGRGRRVAPRVA